MAGIILLRAQLSLGSQRLGYPLGGALVIGRKGDAHMTIVEDGIGRPIGFFDLVQRLSDEIGAHAIARHEGQRALKKVEPPQRRKLVQHQEKFAPSRLRQGFRQPASDLVEDQPDQRLGSRQVGGRHDEIKRDRPIPAHKIADLPVAR